MGAEIKVSPGTCPYCFHIHGRIYLMVSRLCSNQRNRPGYGQLYISDSSETNGRYVSAPEAMWRLNEFSLRKISCNHEVGRSLAKPTASANKKCSDNATSKFYAFKRPVQRAVQQGE
ncbi:hypothetical protein AVEN_129896-1 [Araneus ventricosus]|uniref:Uncharacterized protein n=1 Tax=Araneus ventricosus TaxID=182803 RepID=A0A4Y2R045_ARAVE|nr:hypothetical protein AVEN_129896-1 [Araneus ventricosus]